MSTNRFRLLMWQGVIAGGLSFAAAGLAYSGDAPADDWKAPPRAAKKENPIPANAGTIAAGQKIYAGSCLACHGATGKGDGPAAITCNPPPHNLSDPKIVAQSDGELFWKITEGKKPMPSYEKLLNETDRWNVVNYLRTLSPRPASPSGAGGKP